MVGWVLYSPGLLAQEDHRSEVPYDSLQSVLEEIYERDQQIRVELMGLPAGDSSLPSLIARMNRIDSTNQVQVEQILADFGWLPRSRVGEKAAGTLFLVIQHSDLETMQRYLPVLRTAVQAGEADPTSAAMMEDRVRMYEGKRQLYGTQARSRPKEDGGTEYFVWPIENPEEVNQRRANAGFDLTVEENAVRLNAVYDPNEELPQ